MRAYMKDSLKNRIKRELTILSMLLICMMVISLKPVFAATPTIEYSGKDAKITFENITGTDFFENFKGVMPGDIRSQDILLKSKPLEREAGFYLKAECDEKTKELLKDVKINIDVNGEEVVENGIIFDQVKLGTVEGKATLPVKITMNFPLTMGNEIAEQELHVKWYITVQEDGREIAQGTLPSGKPQTGDQSNIIKYMVILFITGIVAVAMCIKSFVDRKSE